MKHKIYYLTIILLIAFSLYAQDERYKDKDADSKIGKTSSIIDRAGGTHNASNIGLFFENRGKLYPRRVTQGPSGEYPINSGKNYIYRIAPFVGIPNNVIQARHTQNEEWEAVPGFHNSELSQIAFSDNPKTWHPTNGWPVKDEFGNPLIRSDQDSYAVFSDSNNARGILDIEVHQVGHTYGVSFAKDIIFFKYYVINKSNKTYDSLYFSMYSDIDVGNVSGGVPEYGDDKIGFDKEKNFIYFHDDGVSNEWPDQKTGYFGLSFLKTPEINGKEAGITDMHYFLYFDDEDKDYDTLQYGIMSSARSLFESPIGQNYFHLGGNTDLHFDDPATIPASGIDIVAMSSSGPYTVTPNDTLLFVTAIVAGENYEGISNMLANAYRIMDLDFEISKPPATPTLSGVAGDSKATLFWNDVSENSVDNFSGEKDFEGYRLYRSRDNGVNWDKLADYNIASASGLQYSFVDTSVTNGFEYWYSITAYDRGDTAVTSLESPKGNTTDAINLVSLKPLSAAAGYSPVSSEDVTHIGSGNSNYDLNVKPADIDSLAGNEYEVGFTFVGNIEKGNAKTQIEIQVRDSAKTEMTDYAMVFIDHRSYELINLNTDEVIEPTPKSYVSGRTYNFNAGLAVVLTDTAQNADFRPQAGDMFTFRFAVYAVRNQTDTVIYPRRLELNQQQATSDGVIFTISKPDLIQDISRVGGTDFIDIQFSVDDESLLKNSNYLVSVEGSGQDSEGANFLVIHVRDDSMNTIAAFDTVYSLDRIYFNGVEARVEYNSSQPPAPGNVFSIKTIIPIAPNLLDKYQFKIKGSSIDRNQVAANISNIKVVPNPYIVSSLYEPEFGELRREPLRQIQFINLPNECTIYIFTVDADLVKTINHSSTNGTAIWDLRSEGGREIAAGVYIYVVKSGDIEYKSRFAVIK